MLNYKNIINNPNKEVRDPVSGYSYPISVNDMHAQERSRETEKQDTAMSSMLASILK